MNDKSQKVFGRIARQIPKHLQQNVTKKIVNTEQIERAHQVLESRDVPAREKKRVQRMLDRGAFDDEEVVENEAVTKKLDAYNEKAVAAAIASGELPDPSKDPFVQSRMQRIKNKGNKPKVIGYIKVTDDRVLIRPMNLKPKSTLIIVPPSSGTVKNIITGLVVGIGPKVSDYSLLGRAVVMQGFDYDFVQKENEVLYITRESNLLMLIDPDFKGTIE